MKGRNAVLISTTTLVIVALYLVYKKKRTEYMPNTLKLFLAIKRIS